MLKTVKNKFSTQEGVSVIELLVVITIASAISASMLVLITTTYSSIIRSSQSMDKQSSIEELYGYLTARIGSSTKIGLARGTTKNPVDVADETVLRASISGDQFFINSKWGAGESVENYCIRIFHSNELKQVRAAIMSGECSGVKESNAGSRPPEDIYPYRGPNSTYGQMGFGTSQKPLPSGKTLTDRIEYGLSPTDPDYDPVLDDPSIDNVETSKSIVLAENIDSNDNTPIFSYKDITGIFRTVDNTAPSPTNNAPAPAVPTGLYSNTTESDKLVEIGVNSNFVSNNELISDKKYKQLMPIGVSEICKIP